MEIGWPGQDLQFAIGQLDEAAAIREREIVSLGPFARARKQFENRRGGGHFFLYDNSPQ